MLAILFNFYFVLMLCEKVHTRESLVSETEKQLCKKTTIKIYCVRSPPTLYKVCCF